MSEVATATIHLKDAAKQAGHINQSSKLVYYVDVDSPGDIDFKRATIATSDRFNAPAVLHADGRTVTVTIPAAPNPVPFTLTWACPRDVGGALVATVTETIVKTA